MSKNDERDLEPIRQTALVIEDMLKVVTGELPKYPFDRKKVVTGAPKIGIDQSRSQSLAALKNKKVQVLQRLPPGGYKSNLAKQRQEEL